MDNVCSDCGFATYEQAVNNTIAKTYYLGKDPWRMDTYWENVDPTQNSNFIISTENAMYGKEIYYYNHQQHITECYLMRTNDLKVNGYVKQNSKEWTLDNSVDIKYTEYNIFSTVCPDLLPSNDELEIISYENSVFTVKDYYTYEITIKDGLIVKVRNVELLAVRNFSYDSDLTVKLPSELKE